MRKIIPFIAIVLLLTSCAATKYQRDIKRKSKDCDCKKVKVKHNQLISLLSLPTKP